MSNEQLARDYRITDSDLNVFTQHICDCITRDITEFTIYGITATNVTALQTLCDAFELFPTDEFIHQEYLSAVEAMDNLIDALHFVIRAMALCVELKWGKKSPKYKSLGIADLSQLPVYAYITKARMVHAFMTEHLAELSAEGLTEAMLDDMEVMIQSLDDAIRETIDKSSYRVEKTTERITDGNQLYHLVSKYCEIGKRICDKVNPAFYYDYVIFDKYSPSGLTAPANLKFSYNYMDLSCDVVANATSYELDVDTGVGFKKVYAGDDNKYAYTPHDGKSLYRVRARNDGGYGPFSVVFEQYYFAVLPAPENIDVYMIQGYDFGFDSDKVETATSYNIFVSNVDVGQPVGEYVSFRDTSNLPLTVLFRLIVICISRFLLQMQIRRMAILARSL